MHLLSESHQQESMQHFGEIQKELADTETMLHELTLGRRVKAAPDKPGCGLDPGGTREGPD